MLSRAALSPAQLATVAAVFWLSAIAALLLVLWFGRRNRKARHD